MFSGPENCHSSLCVFTFRRVPPFSPLINRFVPLFSKIKISIHVLHVPENSLLDISLPKLKSFFPMLKNPCEVLISLPTFPANSRSDLDRSKLDMQQKYIDRVWWIKGWIREGIFSHSQLERCHNDYKYDKLPIYLGQDGRNITFHFMSSFDLIFPTDYCGKVYEII